MESKKTLFGSSSPRKHNLHDYKLSIDHSIVYVCMYWGALALYRFCPFMVQSLGGGDSIDPGSSLAKVVCCQLETSQGYRQVNIPMWAGPVQHTTLRNYYMDGTRRFGQESQKSPSTRSITYELPTRRWQQMLEGCRG